MESVVTVARARVDQCDSAPVFDDGVDPDSRARTHLALEMGIGWMIGRRSTAHITRNMVLGCTPVPVAVWCATTVQGPAAADWSALLYSLATAVPVLRLLYSVPATAQAHHISILI